MSSRRACALVASVLTAAIVAGACSAASSATPAATTCGGISADIGGCRPDRPAFQSTDCEGLADEWSAEIERLVSMVFAEEAVRDGKQRSVRIHDAMVLATITVGLRLDELGLLGTCRSGAFVETADAAFSPTFRGSVGRFLYDGEPVATWDQYLFELGRVIEVIDVEAPAAS